MIFKHDLRGTPSERYSHQPAVNGRLAHVGRYQIQHHGPVWTHSGHVEIFASADEQLGLGLVDGLLENVKWSVAIGREQHSFAVRGPGPWVIFPLIQSQSFGLG